MSGRQEGHANIYRQESLKNTCFSTVIVTFKALFSILILIICVAQPNHGISRHFFPLFDEGVDVEEGADDGVEDNERREEGIEMRDLGRFSADAKNPLNEETGGEAGTTAKGFVFVTETGFLTRGEEVLSLEDFLREEDPVDKEDKLGIF